MKENPGLYLIKLLPLIAITVMLVGCKHSEKPGMKDGEKNALVHEYVGRQACAECHKKEHDLYQHSDHDMAMDITTEKTVLGNFDNSSFTHFGITTNFYQKDSSYYVFTEGPDGEMTEYKISYTFGVRPLQQYLIEFPRGAYQCLCRRNGKLY